MATLLNNSHSFELLNTNGNTFARITKVGKDSFYVNEYPEYQGLGRWMDMDGMADYVYDKFASNWRAKHLINLLIVGEDYEYSGTVSDCYKAVK